MAHEAPGARRPWRAWETFVLGVALGLDVGLLVALAILWGWFA